MRVALATYGSAPSLTPDDQLFQSALGLHAVTAIAAVWSDPSIDWTTFDAVIIRSCWDYHLRYAQFLDWIGSLERAGILTLNRPDVVRWNSNKRYLLELAAHDVAVIPTVLLSDSKPGDVVAVAEQHGWTRFVVKPVISASAFLTHAIQLPVDPNALGRIAAVLASGDVLLQPFITEVETDGELSLVFIDGEFSHAAQKRPAAGDFRVQSEHGGTSTGVTVPQNVINEATALLHRFAADTLYARVDGVMRGTFVLMELELIEPFLYLSSRADAADSLAKSVIRRIGE